MTEKNQQDKQWQWICRILISLDILLLISGYISFLQTRWQIRSPLIPENTVTQIILDTRIFEAGIAAGVLLLMGTWFYFFNRYKTAMLILAAALPVYWSLPDLFYL